ncbi:uncharacterized protein LOC128261912 [Drosophila gunungcola]|uniref:Uncharacterized protein n=1 Tax=Drosophila gunungcola TaxID=103775 RepID=A0A9P9YU82_9MUSC|nr:uncharacterized protein LOC128261912 [Drosophila gunungcola]KAI8043218.1 hypothetical protein M5D96_004545 [Drosophila gunungcola]
MGALYNPVKLKTSSHSVKMGEIGIVIFCLMVSGGFAVPTELVRYSQLGDGPPPEVNISSVTTTDNLILKTETSSAAPEFEYALIGEDPQDQQWFRVSLTPKTNKTGYRAQFATRKHPPFDAQVAHRHDKTIQDLLNWLDRSEDQSLWKVYRDLLEYTPQAQRSQEFPISNEIEKEGKVPRKQGCRNNNHRLLLEGEEPTSTSPSPSPSKTQSPNNLVYFIKGLQ